MGAFYSNTISGFLDEGNQTIVGSLATQSGLSGFYQLLHTQTGSWNEEIAILKKGLQELIEQGFEILDCGILLEYPIARREKRIDVVILAMDLVLVIEFKVGSNKYTPSDKEQVLDYCLDLRDFHFESRTKTIIPFLLATKGADRQDIELENFDRVKSIRYANASNFSSVLTTVFKNYGGVNKINYKQWNISSYSPTPTIIEAAQTLYAGKSINEISRSHAGTINLTKTSNAVVSAIKSAKKNHERIICFITGVPGAGKTLAGLNIAHDKEFQTQEASLATFLSGNVPLINVLRTALYKDAHKKFKRSDPAAKEKESKRLIAFVENVHTFLKKYWNDSQVPNNKIVIFDEAQRAWSSEHSMKKFKRPFSEPEMLFEIMNRHPDWSVIVALVGGGQEINTGEAGLPEWGKVLQEKFPDWKVYISPQLKTGDHSTGNLTLFKKVPDYINIIEDEDLHLDVSIRSYKAEELSNWVSLLLLNQPANAKYTFDNKLSKYKMVITRDLNKAKKWLASNCKGSRRMGLVASSGGRRLKPYGLEVRNEFEDANWFLNGRSDVRSSYYLEIPATEFGIQGLELDWTGVCWDLDLYRSQNGWEFHQFKGTKWQDAKNEEKRSNILNKYRVLLTRAREGMVIFVPEGDINDLTRPPSYYNLIADYLKSCGVIEI